MNSQKFGIVVADPPWSFKTYSDKGKLLEDLDYLKMYQGGVFTCS